MVPFMLVPTVSTNHHDHHRRALSDQVASGALDVDCQLLAWLAARAVDWPKTGVWRAEDTKLFEIIQRRVRLAL